MGIPRRAGLCRKCGRLIGDGVRHRNRCGVGSRSK